MHFSNLFPFYHHLLQIITPLKGVLLENGAEYITLNLQNTQPLWSRMNNHYF